MRRIFSVVIAVVVVAVVVLGLQNGWFEKEPYNVIIISVDTLRPDHLGCYGYGSPTSPAIDALFDRGVRFTRAVCQTPTTGPSFCSIMTGAYPHTHGSLQNAMPLRDDIQTLAEVLKEHQYHTAAFVSSYTVSDESSGLGRGFDRFDDEFAGEERSAGCTNDSLFAYLEDRSHTPLFIWIHYFEPHGPYIGHSDSRIHPASPRSEAPLNMMEDNVVQHLPWVSPKLGLDHYVRLYDGEIAHVDRRIGILLGELQKRSLLENTLVVFLSDHGESFDHGLYCRHGLFLYESSIRIPLAFVFPAGKHGGGIVEGVVQSIDIPCTICDFLGFPPPEGAEGRSLLPMIEEGESHPGTAFLERRRYEEDNRFGVTGSRHAIRTAEWKYIHSTEEPDELYNLQLDPGELRNLVEEEPDRAASMLDDLQAWIGEAGVCCEELPELSDEAREKLKALGYIQ
ncbi:MAG: sulfatase [Candidatus Eisenbacteria sp.]|nr:sulfatase [Candidatus Eisenbacteria bacterium]